MSEIQPYSEHFPVLTGNIEQDTDELIGELKVGTIVVERGLARLYLVWLSNSYIQLVHPKNVCTKCGLEGLDKDNTCASCGGKMSVVEEPMFPTFESYVGHVSEQTGKSRQTIFNRLRTYRSLSDERGVHPGSVFALNMLSAGAARKLAAADEEDEYLTLVNNSWTDTVDKALGFESKKEALEFVKYDVLHEPKISSEFKSDKDIAVYLERDNGGEEYIVEQYNIVLEGNWSNGMLDWIGSKLGASRDS